MKPRWVGCACLLVLATALPAGASARRLEVRGNLWWSGTIHAPGKISIQQISARPVRTEGCFLMDRTKAYGGYRGSMGGYSLSTSPHSPSDGGVGAEYYDRSSWEVFIFCVSEAPARTILEVEGRVTGARWGRDGILFRREWDLAPTPVHGQWRPVVFRRGAVAWLMPNEQPTIFSIDGETYVGSAKLRGEPPGTRVFGVQATAAPVMLAAVDQVW
ncbi:MAG: hypothetical protein HY775_08520 [Acidobacteria bacterium]|nr:hypothetical protein [Acidobacteriota bacterium]